MTALSVLVVVAAAQGGFLALLALFLVFSRQRANLASLRLQPRVEIARKTFLRWVAGVGEVADLVVALRTLPRESALEFAADAVATSLAPEQVEALSVALRAETWVRDTLRMGTSREWWRRRQAARILAIVGTPAHRHLLEQLLADRQPAVAVMAVGALSRVADAELIGRALDRYPRLPPVVRRFLVSSLAQVRALVEPALVSRLGAFGEPLALARWIDLAADLRLALAVERAVMLAGHGDPRVRRSVARALAMRPNSATLAALGRLILDADPGVRAAAARSFGAIGSALAESTLVTAAHDDVWQVRYAATLALAQLGETGRAALGRLRGDTDRYVVDMATVISGLGDGALQELVAT